MDGGITYRETDNVIIPTNRFQTPITRQLLDKLPDEVREQFIDCVTNVEFVKRLISPNRPWIKDLEKDDMGRAIVDIANPPLYDNTEFFRKTGMYYEKYKEYTDLRPNANPNSEYGKWMKRELFRCWNGMLRPDGMWIPGYLYWYLNYVPMMVNKQVDKSKNYSIRQEGFPDFWEGVYLRFLAIDQARYGGLYNNFKGGEHYAELASRGKSKSFTLATIGSHNLIIGNTMEEHKRMVCILTAYIKEYLSADKDGTINKFTPIIDHLALHTQFPRLKIVDSPNRMTWQMGYRDKETNAIVGSRNTFAAVACKDNEDKLRGKRGTIMFEEFGSFKNLVKIYNSVRDSVKEGDSSFAQLLLVGTSGNKDSDFEGAKEIVCNPRGYSIYAIPNVYEKGYRKGDFFAYFFPAYLNNGKYQNKDGISDVVAALISILVERYNIKYNSRDPNTLQSKIAENPITPSEALLKTHRSLFPVNEINNRIKDLTLDANAFGDVLVGTLEIKDSKVIFQSSSTVTPIRKYPHDDNKIDGAVEIVHMPENDPKTGQVYGNRYLAGIDPYDDDESQTMSLGSIYILDSWTNELAAYYTGRTMYADEFYEICRRMCIFYNAIANYENNKKGLYPYFVKMNSLRYLTETLQSLINKNMAKVSYGNKQVGTNATEGVNSHARELLRDWLLKTYTVQKADGTEEVEYNLKKIKDLALLQELSLWDGYRNCDRVSALGMCMLLLEDRTMIFGDDMGRTREYVDSIEEDEFFKDNYTGFAFDEDNKMFTQ